MNFNNIINSEQALRQVIPAYPAIMDKRIKPQLDAYSIEFIDFAALAIIGFSDDVLGLHYLDLKNGHFNIVSHNKFSLSIPKLNLPNADNHYNCSLYFLIPGVGHGLRVNGYLTRTHKHTLIQDEQYTIVIEQVYVHCSRAIVRSGLWRQSQGVADDNWAQSLNKLTGQFSSLEVSIQTFIKTSPFIFIKTQDEAGNCEISPRGDPGQVVNIIDANTLLIAERAGNKVAKSMRNILQHSRVSLSFLIPNIHNSLTITGQAQLTSDKTLLEPLSINRKIPKIGILITIELIIFSLNQAQLLSCDLWEPDKLIDDQRLTAFSKVLSHHMNGTGLLGKALTPVIRTIVRHDLKNLY